MNWFNQWWNRKLHIALKAVDDLQHELERTQNELRIAQAKQIAAETLSFERKTEIEHLREELAGVRSQLADSQNARITGLQEMLAKATTAKVEQPPDFQAMRKNINLEAFQKAWQAVKSTRDIERQFDEALLRKTHPHIFQQANGEPAPPPEKDHPSIPVG